MNIVKRLIRWITPTGWTIRQLQYYRDEYRASGVLNWGHDEELQIYKLKPTYWRGVFLAYSKDEYNKEVHYAINDLKYQIEQLENKLRWYNVWLIQHFTTKWNLLSRSYMICVILTCVIQKYVQCMHYVMNSMKEDLTN